ncbi:hypothetical protein JCM5350_004686 [Sporobolomyces pararoseus]
MSSHKRSTSPIPSPTPKRFGSPSTPISPFDSASSSFSHFQWLPDIGPLGTVLHAQFGDPVPSEKVACFDFMGTLVEAVSVGKYSVGPNDWRWLVNRKIKQGEELVSRSSKEVSPVVQKLRDLHDQGYAIVIFSSTAKFDKNFREVVENVCTDLNIPLHAFFSTYYDVYRKPCVGMWLEFEKNWNKGTKINLKESFFVSDASGLGKLDYGRKFALNVPLRFYTPHECFFDAEYDSRWRLGDFNPKKYDHNGPLFMPTSTPLRLRTLSEFDDPVAEVVFFVGRPACGKTFFFNRIFEKPGFVRITSTDTNQLSRYLQSRISQNLYVIDVPLPSRASRLDYIQLFQDISSKRTSSSPPLPPFTLRCFNFLVSEEVAKHNSQFAELWDQDETEEGKARSFVDEEGFTDWRLSYQVPTLQEGFDEIKEIYFRFDDKWPTEEQGKERLKKWNLYGDCYRRDWVTG